MEDKKKICRVAASAGNFDRDSNRVKYVGHTLEYTNPIIIAALASSPYYSDIAQANSGYNYTNWVTTFGRSTSTSGGTTQRVGFSAGTTVELEQGINIFGLKAASFKQSTSFKRSKNWDWTTNQSITKTVTYSCVGGEDRAIFTSVPIDRYRYEILESPDGDEIGRRMSIKLPRDYSTYSVTKDFYNENNGDLPDLSMLAHTLGNPQSYPTEAAEGASDAGITSLKIAVETGQEKTYSMNPPVPSYFPSEGAAIGSSGFHYSRVRFP